MKNGDEKTLPGIKSLSHWRFSSSKCLLIMFVLITDAKNQRRAHFLQKTFILYKCILCSDWVLRKRYASFFLEVKKVPKHYFRNCSNYPKSSDSEIIGGLYFSVSLKINILKKITFNGATAQSTLPNPTKFSNIKEPP